MKKWGLMEIKDVLKKMGEEMGKSCEHIPVTISKRMTSTLGYFEFYVNDGKYDRPIKFTFSESLLTSGYTDEEIISVIKHEYCHFYTNETYKMSCGHNKYFKETCKKAGVLATTFLESGVFVEETPYKWDIICDKCGVLGQYKVKRNVSKYVCEDCGGRVYLKEIL